MEENTKAAFTFDINCETITIKADHFGDSACG